MEAQGAINMLILSILVFFSVSLALAGFFLWLTPTKTEQRVQTLISPEEKTNWIETAEELVGPIAKLSSPAAEWETSQLRIKFINAGIRRADARFSYFGAKSLLPLVFAGIAFFLLRAFSQATGLTLIMYLMLLALIGCYLPNLVLYWLAKRRKREIFENFPDAADLMLVCIEAGMGLDTGLALVADDMNMQSVALAEELHLTNREVRAGSTREKSLRNLALRTGVEEINAGAAGRARAGRGGTSIGESLRVFSDDLRHKRQTRAEEMAAKVPTKMLFPLVVCIFPSIIMVVIGPAAIQIIRTFLPMINKGG